MADGVAAAATAPAGRSQALGAGGRDVVVARRPRRHGRRPRRLDRRPRRRAGPTPFVDRAGGALPPPATAPGWLTRKIQRRRAGGRNCRDPAVPLGRTRTMQMRSRRPWHAGSISWGVAAAEGCGRLGLEALVGRHRRRWRRVAPAEGLGPKGARGPWRRRAAGLEHLVGVAVVAVDVLGQAVPRHLVV